MKAGDMMFVDGEGVLSSIIYGPDRRTRISGETRNVIFTIYGVPGIEPERIREHGALLFHAYTTWKAGSALYFVDVEASRHHRMGVEKSQVTSRKSQVEKTTACLHRAHSH